MDGRLRKELGSAAFFLSGLRYDRNQAKAIQRRLNMILEDSVTYQWVVAEGRALGIAQGRVEAAQDNILLLAGERFGPAPAAAEAAVRAVADPDRLKRLTLRVLTAAGWDDLLATS